MNNNMTTTEKIKLLTESEVIIYDENGYSHCGKISHDEAWALLDCTDCFTKKYNVWFNSVLLNVEFPNGVVYKFLDRRLAALA